MKNRQIKTFAGAAVALAGLSALPASAMDILARVISSTPVVQQVTVPRQVCSNETVMMQAPRSGAGALMGAIAGGAAGNAIGNGNGSGRAVATMIGLVGGAMVGEQIEGPRYQTQNVQQCTTQTFYENRASHYNVVYEYQRTQYTAQMATDPGLYVRLQVSPVGALPSLPPAYPPDQRYQPAPQPQAYYPTAPVSQPPAYYAPAPVQPVYVQPAAYPAYYGQPSYAPYYPRIGLSLNFGYSRSYGGGGRHPHRR